MLKVCYTKPRLYIVYLKRVIPRDAVHHHQHSKDQVLSCPIRIPLFPLTGPFLYTDKPYWLAFWMRRRLKCAPYFSTHVGDTLWPVHAPRIDNRRRHQPLYPINRD